MEKAICPHCEMEIDINKIVKKLFGGKSQMGSVVNKVVTAMNAPLSVAYLCPNCSKILGITK